MSARDSLGIESAEHVLFEESADEANGSNLFCGVGRAVKPHPRDSKSPPPLAWSREPAGTLFTSHEICAGNAIRFLGIAVAVVSGCNSGVNCVNCRRLFGTASGSLGPLIAPDRGCSTLTGSHRTLPSIACPNRACQLSLFLRALLMTLLACAKLHWMLDG